METLGKDVGRLMHRGRCAEPCNPPGRVRVTAAFAVAVGKSGMSERGRVRVTPVVHRGNHPQRCDGLLTCIAGEDEMRRLEEPYVPYLVLGHT